MYVVINTKCTCTLVSTTCHTLPLSGSYNVHVLTLPHIVDSFDLYTCQCTRKCRRSQQVHVQILCGWLHVYLVAVAKQQFCFQVVCVTSCFSVPMCYFQQTGCMFQAHVVLSGTCNYYVSGSYPACTKLALYPLGYLACCTVK